MATLTVKDFSGGITDFPVGAPSNQFEMADNMVIDEYGHLRTRPGQVLWSLDGGYFGDTYRIHFLIPQYTGTSKTRTIMYTGVGVLRHCDGTNDSVVAGGYTFGNNSHVYCHSSWNEHSFIAGYNDSGINRPYKVFRQSSGSLQAMTAGLHLANVGSMAATGGSGANYIYAVVLKRTYTVGSTEYIDRSRPVYFEATNVSSNPSGTPIALSGISTTSSSGGSGALGWDYQNSFITKELYRTVNGGSVFYYVADIAYGTTTYNDSTTDSTLLDADVTLYTTGGVLENDRPPDAKFIHSTSDITYYANGYEILTDSTAGELIPQRLWQSKRGDPDAVPASFYCDIEEPITGISSIKSIPIVFGENSVYRIDGVYDDLGRGGMVPRKISDGTGCVGHLSIVQTLDGLYFAGNDGFYFTDGYKVYSITAESFKASYTRLIETATQRQQMCGTFDPANKRVLWAVRDEDGDTFVDNNKIYCLYLPTKSFTTWSSGYRGSGPVFDEVLTYNNPSTAPVINGGSVPESVEAEAPVLLYEQTTANLYDRLIGNGVWVASTTSSSITLNVTGSEYGPAPNGSSVRVLVFSKEEPDDVSYYGNFAPSAIAFMNGSVYQGSANGGIITRYDNDTLTDPVPNIGWSTYDPDTDLVSIPIQCHYAGSFLDMGTTEYRKWVNKVLLKLKPRVDITSVCAVTPYGENDDDDVLREAKPIFQRGFYLWGELTYGDPRLWQRRQKVIDEQRRFPKNGLRCEYKQLHLRNAFVDLYSSDVYGDATVVGSDTGYVTLEIESDLSSYPFSYWIYFAGDDYTQGFPIAVGRGLTAANQFNVVVGSGSVDPTGGWVIRGYPRNNYINLFGYSFSYEVLGDSQNSYMPSTTAGGA